MAVTVTPVTGASYVEGNKRVRVYDVAVTGSATVVTPTSVGLRKIDYVSGVPLTASATFLWDPVAGTLGVGTGRVAFIGY